MEENWKDYYHKGLAAFITIAMCILFFFLLFRFDRIQAYARMIMKILRPFAFGAVIAYLLSPVCNWFERRMAEFFDLEKRPEETARKLKKLFSGISIFLSLFLFCFVIYVLVAMVVSQVFSSIQMLVNAMPGYIVTMTSWLENLVREDAFLINYVEQYSEQILNGVQDFARTQLLPNINNIISGGSISVLTLLVTVKDLVIGLIVAVYFMNSRRLFAHQAKLVVRAVFSPKEDLKEDRMQAADWILKEADIINDYLGGFIKGKLLDSLIIGLICMIFTSIVDMPYAVLVSVVIGVTNIIPFFGPFIGAIPTAILILVVDPVKCVYFIIFILVLQQFDGNILGPKILGNTTHLSSFWVLFAILLFGGVFGIVGMVIGVPVFAFFYQLVREWVFDRLKKQKQKKETAKPVLKKESS
ncbi:MAG: AI-2E family transporter [Lachnospiraceae bacterium]|nr:AI-2E family transporter [Lachnospiraceae bacterium]